MTSRMKRRRIFLETSGVIYHRHGDTRMRAAVLHAVSDGVLEVSNFIRMEYLRGFVVNLIELYFLIRESDSVSDALIDWSQKVRQERKLKVLLLTMSGWLLGHEDWESQDKSLRRLGEQIVRLVYEFDEIFSGRAKDQLSCRLGRVDFPRRSFNEDTLLRFYERFRQIQRTVVGAIEKTNGTPSGNWDSRLRKGAGAVPKAGNDVQVAVLGDN